MLQPTPLSVRLAGVNISPAGADFLTKDLRLRDKEVIFTVVKPIDDQSDIIDADITLKKVNSSLNAYCDIEQFLKLLLEFLSNNIAARINSIARW